MQETTTLIMPEDYPEYLHSGVRFGENLLDLTHQIKGEALATVVIPLGFEDVRGG